jgi:hypothetical protein
MAKKIKPIEQLTEDVKKGDLVRFELTKNNEYIGYFRGTGKKPYTPFKGKIHYLFAPIFDTKSLGYFPYTLREDTVNVNKKRLLWHAWRSKDRERSIEGYEILRRDCNGLKNVARIKPIKIFIGDVKKGDLVRFKLAKDNEYVGYFNRAARELDGPSRKILYWFAPIRKTATYDTSAIRRKDAVNIGKEYLEWTNKGSLNKRFSIEGYEILRRAK